MGYLGVEWAKSMNFRLAMERSWTDVEATRDYSKQRGFQELFSQECYPETPVLLFARLQGESCGPEWGVRPMPASDIVFPPE